MISRTGRWQDTSQVLVELPDGERRYIPTSWTDLAAQSVYPHGMRFPLEQLVAVCQRLAEMQGCYPAGMMAAITLIEPTGGSHASVHPDQLGRPDPPTAHPDHPPPGADAPAPTGSEQGGAG